MKSSTKPPLPSKQYHRDACWLVRHYRKLSMDSPNKWVAVYKGRVVAVGDDSGSVERLARQRTGVIEVPVQLVDDGTIIS